MSHSFIFLDKRVILGCYRDGGFESIESGFWFWYRWLSTTWWQLKSNLPAWQNCKLTKWYCQSNLEVKSRFPKIYPSRPLSGEISRGYFQYLKRTVPYCDIYCLRMRCSVISIISLLFRELLVITAKGCFYHYIISYQFSEPITSSYAPIILHYK